MMADVMAEVTLLCRQRPADCFCRRPSSSLPFPPTAGTDVSTAHAKIADFGLSALVKASSLYAKRMEEKVITGDEAPQEGSCADRSHEPYCITLTLLSFDTG